MNEQSRDRKGAVGAKEIVPMHKNTHQTVARLAADARRKMAMVDNIAWADADDVAIEISAGRIAAARKAAGPTQVQLAAKLKMPQPQISRIERNPDRTTVRTLQRVAAALDVDLGVLLKGAGER